jgi:mRNA-degrading endonuclease toxin of MazEF toxin-antitoxin module
VIVQASDLAPLSTVVGCPTSQSARPARFRPRIELLDQTTRVLCEQVGALDVDLLGEHVGYLSFEEQLAVDEALRLVLDL